MNDAMAKMIFESVRFAVWAAGQGIFPVEGEPSLSPEDFIFDYCRNTGCDDWDRVPEMVRRTLGRIAGERTTPGKP